MSFVICRWPRMVRNYKRSRVARSYGIPTTTLFRQFDNVKNLAFVPDDFQLAKVHHRQVLKFEYENELWLQQRLGSWFIASCNGIKCPTNWTLNKTAGKDWFGSFLKRNSCLSLRKAEATSQARAAAFNYPIVHGYQQKLHDILQRHNYPSHRIFNADETSNLTVMSPGTVVAIRGTKQVLIRFIFISLDTFFHFFFKFHC